MFNYLFKFVVLLPSGLLFSAAVATAYAVRGVEEARLIVRARPSTRLQQPRLGRRTSETLKTSTRRKRECGGRGGRSGDSLRFNQTANQRLLRCSREPETTGSRSAPHRKLKLIQRSLTTTNAVLDCTRVRRRVGEFACPSAKSIQVNNGGIASTV